MRTKVRCLDRTGGSWIPTPTDQECQQKELAQQQTEQQRQEKELAQQQTEQVRQRAERLAERLRAMGINPDEV